MAAEHIPDSDQEEVLFERLNFLLDYHGPQKCFNPYCRECERLAEIRQQLLLS